MKTTEQSAPTPQSFTFNATPEFRKRFKALKKKYPSLSADLDGLRNVLLTEPRTGMPLGRDAFKCSLHWETVETVITCFGSYYPRLKPWAIKDDAGI